MTDKYDRQLRLWGGEGQRALMEARICVIGAGPTATETLKNLVLPGCGFVCIIDPDCCSPRDLGNNFFFTATDLGQPRAKVALTRLLELNDDVKGDFRVDAFDHILREEPAFFKRFNLVIATQQHEQALTGLSTFLYENCVTLLIARAYGLVGTCAVVTPEHCILNVKSDDTREDLRIGAPFPALRAYVDALDLRALDSMEFGHVPFLALLVKAMDTWRASTKGCDSAAVGSTGSSSAGRKVPASRAEKEAFKAVLHAMGSVKGPLPANFLEALESAQLAWTMESPIPETLELLNDVRADVLSSSTSEFWLVIRAIRDFAARAGALPVSGRLPDMTATTDLYVSLQRLFQSKSAEDVAAVVELVEAHASSCGVTLSPRFQALTEHMCKHVRSLRCIRCRPLAARLAVSAQSIETIQDEFRASASTFTQPEQAPVAWFIMQRAVDAFREKHGRFPSSQSMSQTSTDAHLLFLEAQSILSDFDVSDTLWGPALSIKHAEEMCRYDAAELHAVAAIMGGIASQEAVKLITQQYLPITGVFVFNGVAGISQTIAI